MKSNHIPPWFELENIASYVQWRDWKQAAYPASLDQLIVDVDDANALTQNEENQLQAMLDRYNLVIYRVQDETANKLIPLQIGQKFRLQTLDNNLGAGADAVTEIRVKQSGVHGRYIPYTTHKLSWHTDGYYNLLSRQIRAMTLHCVRPAASGGENQLLDHEMAYIYLREIDPEYIRALSLPDTMTIPANVIDGKTIRKTQTGPVFSFDKQGYLHMRYTARKKNIVWKNTADVKRAVDALDKMFDECEWILQGTLAAGEGLLCNNVLHNRRAFAEDSNAPRLLYRLRYYERAPTAALHDSATPG